jgi:hydroxymethylpyrimidine pyrophosphatase-like HAD family hydrolase
MHISLAIFLFNRGDKMEIKAVALDLDGTLLTTDKKISDINRDVLKELEQQGVKIFIVTP